MKLIINHKAFTLIELLVVVAIIGILAAVGVVAYNGYTKAAKQNATKSNHTAVIKYINAELMKCELFGTDKVMDNNLTCSGRTGKTVVEATIKALSHFKNPFDTTKNAVRVNAGHNAREHSGYVNLYQNTHVLYSVHITLYTCFIQDADYPCSQNDHKLVSTLNFE